MATVAQLQSERKNALREVRRRERTADSQIERLEREIFRLLDRKTLLTVENAISLTDKYRTFVALVTDLEKSIVDFVEVFND